MKIKNLKIALIAVFAFVGISAFATTDPKLENVLYAIVDDTPTGADLDHAKTVRVDAVESEFTTLAIPASFYKTNVDDSKTYFKVIGFNANWDKVAGKKDITKKLTSLTIAADFFTDLSNVFTNLEALTSVSVTSAPASWTNTGWVTGPLVGGNAKIKETLTTIDLTGLTKCTLVSAANTFKDLPELTSVTLPASIEEIGANAFRGSKVTALTIPATVKTIGSFAFAESAITSLDLSATEVTEIPQAAFYKAKLTTITLPKGLTTIVTAAFQEAALTAITIPATVKTIEHDAFYQCESLASADLSAAADLTLIDYQTFYGAKALTAITIPAKVAAIGKKAFEDCAALATVTISGDKLTKIDDYAFKGTGITSFEMPATVATFGNYVFEGCEALKTVTAAEKAEWSALGANGFAGCKALESIDLSNTKVKKIGATAFAGCEALKVVKLPASVDDIYADAFKDAVIEELDLSKTAITELKTIFGAHDAKNPNPLKSILLPEGLITLNANVFDYAAIEKITLPATIEDIWDRTDPDPDNWFILNYGIPANAFYYCTKLKTVDYQPVDGGSTAEFAPDAFLGCTPFVKINTNSFYFAAYPWTLSAEPTNATYGATDDLVVTPVKDKGTSGKYFAKICPKLDIAISKEDLGDAKLYSIYVDEGIAYFQALKVQSGYYKIGAKEHAILKANDDTPIEFEIAWGAGSINDDYIFSFDETVQTADFQAHTSMPENPGDDCWFDAGDDYIYALTNSASNGGFGFTYYKGATLPAGAFFILSDLAPNKGARLETVWLDEDGNVEGDATAIQKVEAAAEDGAIYNAAGQKVSASYKGLIIKNGKKYIQK